MSRIGKQPIEIPDGVNVAVDPGRVTVNGPLGELTQNVPARILIEKGDGQLVVKRPTERGDDRALHETTTMPSSRMKVEIARLLKDEGYIDDFRVEKGESFDTLVIELKYGRSRERIITDLKRISKPGRRVYAKKDRLPRGLGGMGTAILSTSGGLITARTAAERGVGGEVICFVW